MSITSMKVGPLAYLWLSQAAITSGKLKSEDEVFDLMNSICKSLTKATEHLWYSKIGDVCNAFVKWCGSNGKSKKGLSIVKKILNKVCDSKD